MPLYHNDPQALARDEGAARDPALARRRERIERLANRLDRSFRLPGTQFRFGYDGLIGIVPGIGDTIGFGLSAWLIGEAARAGCRKRVLVMMLGNAAVDSLIGAVPLVGDLFDLGFKANVRNARLAANELRRIESDGRQSETFGTVPQAVR